METDSRFCNMLVDLTRRKIEVGPERHPSSVVLAFEDRKMRVDIFKL